MSIDYGSSYTNNAKHTLLAGGLSVVAISDYYFGTESNSIDFYFWANIADQKYIENYRQDFSEKDNYHQFINCCGASRE